SPLTLILLFLSEAVMKYLLSRLLMRAAVLGAKNPLRRMVAISDLPIIAILPVSTYCVWSVRPSSTFRIPNLSLAGVGDGAGLERPSGPDPALAAALAAMMSCAFFVSSTTVASSLGVTGPGFSAGLGEEAVCTSSLNCTRCFPMVIISPLLSADLPTR